MGLQKIERGECVKDFSNIKEGLEAIQGFAKYLLIPTAVTTFLPDNWLEHMGLLTIKESTIGIWISVIFWMSLSIVVIDFLKKVKKRIDLSQKLKQQKKSFAKIMMGLTDSEKDIVYKIFIYDTYNFDPIGDAAITKLISLKVVYHSKGGRVHSGISFGLQPQAREFLIENPDYLEEYASSKREQLIEAIEELEKDDSFTHKRYGYDDLKNEEVEKLKRMLQEYTR